MPKPDFEKLLLQAVDEGLSSLGDSSKQAIYFHLDRNFCIKKEQIPKKIDEFTNAIENIFGIGANFIEIAIMKELHRKVGASVSLNSSKSIAFKQYVAFAKRAFREKEKASSTTKEIIECEGVAVEV